MILFLLEVTESMGKQFVAGPEGSPWPWLLAQTKIACAEKGDYRWTEVSHSPKPVGNPCLESGCCWLWAGCWVLEEVGVQWEVMMFVLLAAVNLPSMLVHQKGFCIPEWDTNLSLGAKKDLPANSASSTERAKISKFTPIISEVGAVVMARTTKLGFWGLPLDIFWLGQITFIFTKYPHFLTSKIRMSPSPQLLKKNLIGTGLDCAKLKFSLLEATAGTPRVAGLSPLALCTCNALSFEFF